MLRRWAAALMLAGAATGAPHGAVCAFAQAADSFEVVPRLEAPRQSHRAAWACALAGVGLIAASFPLSDLADTRYSDYLEESDPAAIEDAYQSAVRADHLSSGALIAGEALLVGAVWLRFVHRPHPSRTALVLRPDRCAVQLRF